MNLSKEDLRKIRGLILFTIVILVGLWKYESVLAILGFLLDIIFPFLLGGAIAFILNVPMGFLERVLFGKAKGKGNKAALKLARPVSLLLTILLVGGVIFAVMIMIIPELGNTLSSLSNSIKVFFPKLQKTIESYMKQDSEVWVWLNSMEVNWEKMMESAVSFFKSGAGVLMDSTFSAAKSIVSGVTVFVIAFVFSCYILVQKNRLGIQVEKVLYAYQPKGRVEKILRICSLTYKTFSSFLAGQCVEAVILGAMFVATMWVIRLPYALLIGVLIAFTALIPVFGAVVGCLLGAFLILMVDPMKALVFVIMFLILQQIEENLIYPRVVGSSVGLPSIWVLVAVTVGGSVMGVVGMLIFIPLVSVLYTLFRENVYKKLREKRIEIK